MLNLHYFTKFPAIYKDREKLINTIILNNITTEIKNDKIIISSSTNKYKQIIEIYDKTIHLNSPVKVSCDCESFKYEFANSVFKAGSLSGPVHFWHSIIQRPKEKNQYNIPSGCKHLIKLARECTKIKI